MADLPCPDPEAEAAPEGSPDLNGLAKVWNDDDTIRTMVLHTKSLLAWPSPKMTGVINFNTMRQNSAVIQTVLGAWCTRVATPQTVYIDHMRDEEGMGKKTLQHCFVMNIYELVITIVC